ncbi:hypothetical protein CEXT_145521 [Caerostris extrusa]|uniref:Uncharacterized protein n=1 Tax=Caerostris extrusa TaxID=172846 RepID=A0AAV4R537_CAEEX|nr:hypothetical protein CEXT_145521 [Caerostris extrusa]
MQPKEIPVYLENVTTRSDSLYVPLKGFKVAYCVTSSESSRSLLSYNGVQYYVSLTKLRQNVSQVFRERRIIIAHGWYLRCRFVMGPNLIKKNW